MNCVATIAIHERLNQATNNSNRIACSNNDGDFPRGDLLKLTATSFGTFNFEAIAAAVSLTPLPSETADGGDMIVDATRSRVTPGRTLGSVAIEIS